MKIAVDLDGTLAETQAAFLEELEKREGIKHKLEDLESYYFENAPFSLEKFHNIARENWKTKDIPLTDNSIPEHLNALEKKHQVDIVTARGDVPKKRLKNWARNKGIRFNSLVVDKKKTHLDYDVLIDDSPEYIGNGMKILLYHRPYNRNAKIQGDSERVRNFNEVRRTIESNRI